MSITPWRWIVSVVFLLILWIFCAISIKRATTKLTDLAVLVSPLDSVSIEKGTGRAEPYYVVFNLAKTAVRPGIYTGTNEGVARTLAARFQVGEQLTIYYDATGPRIERGINLFTYQVQSHGQIMYALAEAQHAEWIMAVLFGALAVVFSILVLRKFYKESITSPADS